MDAFDSLEQPLCDYNESMDALPELWETDSFESVSFSTILFLFSVSKTRDLLCELPLIHRKMFLFNKMVRQSKDTQSTLT